MTAPNRKTTIFDGCPELLENPLVLPLGARDPGKAYGPAVAAQPFQIRPSLAPAIRTHHLHYPRCREIPRLQGRGLSLEARSYAVRGGPSVVGIPYLVCTLSGIWVLWVTWPLGDGQFRPERAARPPRLGPS